MSIPPWILALVSETLKNAGRWAAKKLCKKLTGDESCGLVFLMN